jgi:hypothetical protein
MEKPTIAVFFFLFIHITDSGSCRCKNFENNIYQFTITITGYKPFYTLGVFSPNGMFYETSNVANGQNAAELGTNFAFNVHSGFYECLPGNKVHVTCFGYLYQTNDSAVLKTNGAIGVHDYELQFLQNDNRQCNGTFSYALYTTGVNPFDSTNTPLAISANNSVTGQLFNGRYFNFPTSTN